MDNFQSRESVTSQSTPPTFASNQKQGKGTNTAIIVVVLIIILGGVYLWYSKANAPIIETTEKSATDDTALQNDLQAAGNVDVNSDMSDLDATFGK